MISCGLKEWKLSGWKLLMGKYSERLDYSSFIRQILINHCVRHQRLQWWIRDIFSAHLEITVSGQLIFHVLKIQNTYIFVKFKHIRSYQQSNDFKIGKSQFKQMIRTDKTNTNMTLINVETFVLKYKSQVSRKKNTLPNNTNVMGIMLENVQNTY